MGEGAKASEDLVGGGAVLLGGTLLVVKVCAYIHIDMRFLLRYSGDIVRMLLIQMQFLRKEISVAMGALDEVMEKEQMNMNAMAILPAFVVSYGLYTFTLHVLFTFASTISGSMRAGPQSLALEMQRLMRSIDRQLSIIMSLEASAPPLLLGNFAPQLSLRKDLDGQIGNLMLLLHKFQSMTIQHGLCFKASTLAQVQQDVQDLHGFPEGAMVTTTQAQVLTVNRMFRSYTWLESEDEFAFWETGRL
jgi:nuclear-control-of-ATPase protein 2